MDQHFLGPNVDIYVAPDVLVTFKDVVTIECLGLFDEMASFENEREIQELRCDLKNDLNDLYQVYVKVNNERLEAIALANNIKASRKAINRYKELMDQYVGHNVETFIAPNVLEALNEKKSFQCLELFDEMGSFGNETAIKEARNDVIIMMNDCYEVYVRLNSERLEVAASANNIKESKNAIERYNELMNDHLFGPKAQTYVTSGTLEKIDEEVTIEWLNSFDKMACFGDDNAIRNVRQGVEYDLKRTLRSVY